MTLDNYPATKKKIFLAASKLFAQKCYADVGMREIASEAGIQVPTIYNHYRSKEVILEDLFRYFTYRHTEFRRSIAVHDYDDYDQNPTDCFKKLLYVFDDSEMELVRRLLQIIFNEQTRSPQAATIIYELILRDGKAVFYEYLAHLQKKGKIKSKNIDSFAETFPRVVITMAMQFARDDEMDRRPDYEKLLTDLFEQLLDE